MAISGILLNHPEWISHISVPSQLIPSQYRIHNWDRSALIKLVFSGKNRQAAYVAGKLGVWVTKDGGSSFQPFQRGLPASEYYRKTNDIFLWEKGRGQLFAATDGGLFVRGEEDEHWRRIPVGKKRERFLKIFAAGNQLFAVTPSHVYRSPAPPDRLEFQDVTPRRLPAENKVTLVRLFFDMHGGKIWGFPGKLLYDLTGLMIIFLSISSFYTWYFPKRRKPVTLPVKDKKTPFRKRLFRIFFKYHLKLGIWFALFLFIMAFTGFFMRPPPLALIATGSVNDFWYPGSLPHNPWDEKIQNALFDSVTNRIIIEATDGFWTGPVSLSRPFHRIDFPAPVFVMGATVFEPYGKGGFLVGSFNGLFHWKRSTGNVIDMLTGSKLSEDVSPVMPADSMVTGYFKTPGGDEFITTHEQGLLPLGNAPAARFKMPEQMRSSYRMPLWNFMFEIHNGRIFKDLIGGIYILIAPLGSVLFLLITVSGVYDWLYLKIFRKKKK